MKSCEEFVAPESEYFVYAPSKSAQKMFFYPLQCGRFIYKAGYRLHREAYDSFLLIYITEGKLDLTLENRRVCAGAGSFILLDCYQRHAYSCDSGCECCWCHFDGVAARDWYDAVAARLGNVFSAPDFHAAHAGLTAIYDTFALGRPVREPLMSKYLTDILTCFLLYPSSDVGSPGSAGITERIVAYINEHYTENITVEALARLAGLSPYHFIRVFKGETGFTPHEYILHTRISAAKYLLKNSRMSVKDICFRTGFSCESVFCSAFKRRLGVTPTRYRAPEA